jgi:hypothetical protein
MECVMPDTTSPLRSAHDLLLVLGVAWLMIGLGSVAAGVSTRDHDLKPTASHVAVAADNQPSFTAQRFGQLVRVSEPPNPAATARDLPNRVAQEQTSGLPTEAVPPGEQSITGAPDDDRPSSRIKFDFRLELVDMAQSLRRR